MKTVNEKTAKKQMYWVVWLSVIGAVMVLLQFFLPALAVGEQVSGADFAYKNYSGFDAAIFCWPAFILGGQLIGPNPVLIAALLLPILATLICSLMWKNASRVKRIVLSVIMAVSFLYYAVCFLNVPNLVMMTAYPKFEEIVYYAKSKDMFAIGGYAVAASVVSLLAAAGNVVAVICNGKKPQKQ